MQAPACATTSADMVPDAVQCAVGFLVQPDAAAAIASVGARLAETKGESEGGLQWCGGVALFLARSKAVHRALRNTEGAQHAAKKAPQRNWGALPKISAGLPAAADVLPAQPPVLGVLADGDGGELGREVLGLLGNLHRHIAGQLFVDLRSFAVRRSGYGGLAAVGLFANLHGQGQ